MGSGAVRARGKNARIAVPAMPCPVASTCCVLNFLVPGLGTILAGFTVFCCSRNEDLSGCEKLGSFCASFWIGFLQLLTTPLLLLGWIWSCVWGVSFIGMSNEYYHDNPVTENGAVLSTPGANTVITQQPGSSYDQYYHYGQSGNVMPQPAQPYPEQPRPSPSAPPSDPGNYQQPGMMPSYGEPPPPYSPPGTYPATALPPKGSS